MDILILDKDALIESGLIKAAARYNEAVLAAIEASGMRTEMDRLEWQQWMQSCDLDRRIAHDSLVISYRVYVRVSKQRIDGILDDDRFAIADVAEDLLKQHVGR